MRFRDVNEIVAHIIAQVTGDAPREPEQLEFVTFYELRAASIMARIPMRIAAGNVGQASISLATSGSICESWAKEWAKGFSGAGVTSMSG